MSLWAKMRIVLLIPVLLSGVAMSAGEPELPLRGLCAHRGVMDTRPENTMAAFREAIRLGAHMIEFDVYLSKDKKPVIIHDPTLDRTTDGTGPVSDHTLAELKALDAGSWKGPEFAGERIPTLQEALAIMPRNVWLNIQLKGDGELGETVARVVVEEGREGQSFLACGLLAAEGARRAVPDIRICNMERQVSSWAYVDKTIEMKAEFIQLIKPMNPDFPAYVSKLKEHGIRVNYYGTDKPEELHALLEMGVEFPLVNKLGASMEAVRELGIEPVKPEF